MIMKTGQFDHLCLCCLLSRLDPALPPADPGPGLTGSGFGIQRARKFMQMVSLVLHAMRVACHLQSVHRTMASMNSTNDMRVKLVSSCSSTLATSNDSTWTSRNALHTAFWGRFLPLINPASVRRPSHSE